MDWPNAGVAIGSAVAAALGTAIVAIIAINKQAKNSQKDREHTRELAAAQREHDLKVRQSERRSEAYIELMKALNRTQTQVERTEPIASREGDPGPPPNISDEESWALQALADVIASDDVRGLIEDWFKKAREFYSAVWMLGVIREHERREPGRVTAEELERAYGVKSSVGQWQKVDAIRKELRQDVLDIGARVRSEL